MIGTLIGVPRPRWAERGKKSIPRKNWRESGRILKEPGEPGVENAKAGCPSKILWRRGGTRKEENLPGKSIRKWRKKCPSIEWKKVKGSTPYKITESREGGRLVEATHHIGVIYGKREMQGYSREKKAERSGLKTLTPVGTHGKFLGKALTGDRRTERGEKIRETRDSSLHPKIGETSGRMCKRKGDRLISGSSTAFGRRGC